MEGNRSKNTQKDARHNLSVVDSFPAAYYVLKDKHANPEAFI
jgi:hypothetical protein